MVLPDLSLIIDSLRADSIEPKLYPEAAGWKDSSSGGFLAPGEKLVDVVSRDYHVLESLGASYEEMADMASRVLKHEDAKCVPHVVKLGFWSRLFGKSVVESVKSVELYDSARFTSTLMSSMGQQSCPWGCTRDVFGYSPYGSVEVLIRWKLNGEDTFPSLLSDYTDVMMKSLEGGSPIETWFEKNGVMFGGNRRVLYLSSYLIVTDLTPHLIATHHFFEGDACYRTDPTRLAEVIRSKK